MSSFFDWMFQKLFNRPPPAPTGGDAAPTGPATPEAQLIRCPSCGMNNRVAQEKLDRGLSPLCGRCKGRLPVPSSSAPATPPPSRDRLLKLDAADLLPISHAELKESIETLVRRGAYRIGGRGSIPPLTDERTRLIGRALVAHGLLTPDQLLEIHEVAAAMEELRLVQAGAHGQTIQAVGDAAVRAEQERRTRLKEQKKAEAAERNRKRAETIAHRRATDITFLGRGVSAWLGQRQSDAAKLTAAGLPVLSTPADVARALGITIRQLRWLGFHAEVATRVHYVSFTVPKKSGGTRTLSAPHRKLAAAQQWIFENIVSRLPCAEPAHGFIAGRGILSNARPHAGKAIVVNLDLEGFFPSIGFPRVRSVFHRLGYAPAAATILALLCTECPRRQVVYAGQTYHVAIGPRGLPQGASTSPGLSNQVTLRLDRRLGGLAAKLGLTYTRYADDLSFSGGEELESRIGYLLARVRHLVQEEGFAVNEKKTRVLRRNARQLVTGLVVNDNPGVARKEVRRLRAILHRAHSEGLEAQNREGRPNFRAWLLGKIAYVSMARPAVGARLKEQLRALLVREPGAG